jgi:hypothetical protein
MNLNDLRRLEYEELVQLKQERKIGYLLFVLAQDGIANLYTSAMAFYHLDQTDETAEAWLSHFEETALTDDEGADALLDELNA